MRKRKVVSMSTISYTYSGGKEYGMQGKVKWFNQEKGFGFIVGSDNKEYFVHYTQIQIVGFKTLDEGCLVEFDPIEIEKGLQAKNVVKIV